MVNYLNLELLDNPRRAQGHRLRSPNYTQDHYLNRTNLQDAWCGRPLTIVECYYSNRTTNGSLCPECRRKEAEAVEVLKWKGIQYAKKVKNPVLGRDHRLPGQSSISIEKGDHRPWIWRMV